MAGRRSKILDEALSQRIAEYNRSKADDDLKITQWVKKRASANKDVNQWIAENPGRDIIDFFREYDNRRKISRLEYCIKAYAKGDADKLHLLSGIPVETIAEKVKCYVDHHIVVGQPTIQSIIVWSMISTDIRLSRIENNWSVEQYARWLNEKTTFNPYRLEEKEYT